MNEEFSNPFSLTKLKAYLFDLISKETAKQQTLKETISKEQDANKRKDMEETFKEKSLILNNIINKANELTSEIEKLTKDNSTDLKKEEKDNNEETFKENTTVKEEEYPEVILSKETNDPAKAIIVNIKQFKKLQASKMTQQELILNNKVSEEKPKKEFEPVINIASDEVEETKTISNEENDKEIKSEDKPPVQEEQPVENKEDIKTTDEKEENIEELLNKANALYKEGNLQESEALYEKISALNKQKQNKTHIKVA